MPKKYRVTLTAEEREQLTAMVSKGKAAARALTHARILVKTDEAEGGPAWTDDAVCAALDVGLCTVMRVRERFVEEGLDAACALGHRHTCSRGNWTGTWKPN